MILLCVHAGVFRQSVQNVNQELQQSSCIVAIDFTILIVAVTVQSLLVVEGYCVCSLLVQQNCVCNVYRAVQIGITQQQLTRSDRYRRNRSRCSSYIRICSFSSGVSSYIGGSSCFSSSSSLNSYLYFSSLAVLGNLDRGFAFGNAGYVTISIYRSNGRISRIESATSLIRLQGFAFANSDLNIRRVTTRSSDGVSSSLTDISGYSSYIVPRAIMMSPACQNLCRVK